MRPLHDGADRDGERLAAVLALVDAWASALALQFSDTVAHDAAARAYRTLRPKEAFQMLAGLLVIVENCAAEIDFLAGHDLASQL